MKKLILKILLFACIAFSAVESKAFNTQFFFTNTSGVTLTVNVYDISNNLLYSTSTCCILGGVCFSSATVPDHVIITDGTGCSTPQFSVNTVSMTCPTCNATCDLMTGGVVPGGIQYASFIAAGGTCIPANYQMTVTTI